MILQVLKKSHRNFTRIGKIFLFVLVFVLAIFYEDIFCRKCYNLINDTDLIFLQEGISEDKINNLIISSINKIKNIDQLKNDRNSIPLINHYIYIFPEDKTKWLLEKKDQEIILHNSAKLKEQDANWKFYFWTNKKEAVPIEIQKIENIVIKNYDEFQGHILYQDLLDAVNKKDMNKRFYALASDILRLICLEKYGGMYLDVDYKIYDPQRLMKFIQNYDFLVGIFNQTKPPFINTSFMVAKIKHPIIKESISLMHRNFHNDTLLDYVKYPCRDCLLNMINGPINTSVATFKYASDNDVIFPYGIIFDLSKKNYNNKYTGNMQFNGVYYDPSPLGNDSFGGSWMTKENSKNICYSIWKI